MKILFINSVCGIRSTGRICTDLAEEFEKVGHTVKIAYGRESVPEKYQKYAIRIGNNTDNKLSAIHSRITDKHGFANKKATAKFLRWAEEYKPDVLWLHNIHGYYINIKMLFEWIKSHPEVKVNWTLHDCWAFTGHCSHFSSSGCEKWKTGCKKCEFKGKYPKSLLLNRSDKNYEKKKELFTGIEDLTIVTPSCWLASLVKKSFLGVYPVEVINNGIETDVFKPTDGDIAKKYGIENKKIILGVASAWSKSKGLYDFIKLSKMIGEDKKIVLIGLSDKQFSLLPSNILGIKRTNNIKELAMWYTAADVFLNLTYDDTYPTVNLEAQACKTPCITYDTGGSVESVPPENVVKQGDLESIVKIIEEKLDLWEEDCSKKKMIEKCMKIIKGFSE